MTEALKAKVLDGAKVFRLSFDGKPEAPIFVAGALGSVLERERHLEKIGRSGPSRQNLAIVPGRLLVTGSRFKLNLTP